jgi:hypothetical protein
MNVLRNRWLGEGKIIATFLHHGESGHKDVDINEWKGYNKNRK